MPSTDELLIGTTEAAAVLGVNRVTVLRWAIKGRLPIVRRLPGPNGAVLFDAGVVRRLAQKRLLEEAERRAS